MTENRWKKSTKRTIAGAIGVLVVAGIAAATTINSQFFVGKSQILHYWDRNLDQIVPLKGGLIPSLDANGNPVGEAIDTKINLLVSTGTTAGTAPWASARYTWSSAIGTVSKTDLVGGVLPATVGFAAGVPQYLLYNTDFISGDDLGQGLAVGPYLYDGAQWDMARSVQGATDGSSVGIAAAGAYGFNGTSWNKIIVVSDNGTNPTVKLPVLVAKATAAAPAWGEGKIAPVSVALDGSLRTTTSYSYKQMYSTDNVVTIKSGPGILHTIVKNEMPAAENIRWTVYDNTSAAGVKIAAIYLVESWPETLIYDVAFSTGLTISTNTPGGGLMNITVTYK